MDQPAMPIRLAGPEPPDPALLARVAPFMRIEETVCVERSGDFVAVTLAPVRIFAAAGQLETNAVQHDGPP
jgi:hypothetical protein